MLRGIMLSFTVLLPVIYHWGSLQGVRENCKKFTFWKDGVQESLLMMLNVFFKIMGNPI